MDARELDKLLEAGAVSLLDVRGAAEWEAGHLPGVFAEGGNGVHVPLGDLRERIAELPREAD